MPLEPPPQTIKPTNQRSALSLLLGDIINIVRQAVFRNYNKTPVSCTTLPVADL
jgi:hypothetical protein